jgi:predicted HicB family RNase H-like nuclease
MSDYLQHKGYAGSVEYSADDGCLHGRILFIRSLVTFEAQDLAGLQRAFVEALEDYLENCAERGVEPEQSFKGSFNVRITPEAHRKAALMAAREGVSLNKLVERALLKETA